MAYILIVDDEERMRHVLSIILNRKGHSVDQAGDGAQALEMAKKSNYDMIITDIRMPKMDGMTLLNHIRELNLPVPVIFITAFATVDSAVEAMRQGAADYITKPFEEERIFLTVERTINLSRILAENRDLKTQLKMASRSDDIVYVSDKMREVMDLAARVAETDSPVLITGDSGTGKEVLAKFIYRASHRRKQRFVPVNCAAISPNLVESELFGHEKGAFTGAERRTAGKFEYASGGTLFMDEIGDLPLEAQAKLLRTLQEKKIQRVGGNEEIPVDVRVICATNQNLQQLVEEGSFRQDLYFRINVFPIETPPLRERMEDIMPLAGYFLNTFSCPGEIEFSNGAERCLKAYTWPGNVRELANAVERAVILARGKGLITGKTLSFICPQSEGVLPGGNFRLPPSGISLEALEKDLVRQALEASDTNQTAAAKLLGLTRAKFRVLMKQVKQIP